MVIYIYIYRHIYIYTHIHTNVHVRKPRTRAYNVVWFVCVGVRVFVRGCLYVGVLV